MRILLLTYEFPPVVGGIATYSASIASAASTLGHDVTIAAFGGWKHDTGETTEYPLSLHRFGSGMYSAAKIVALLWRTYRLADPSRYDLIHALDWPTVMAMTYLNRFRNIPFAATAYGTEILMASESRQIRYLARGRLFSEAEKIFAISEFTKRLLLDHDGGIDPKNIVVTPLGVDYDHFSDPKRHLDVRAKYSIPPQNKIILTVARLDERKGHKTVLAALGKLPGQSRENVSYIIAGAGGSAVYKDELEVRARECGVQVIFAGRIDYADLPSLYTACDIFCMIGRPHPGKVEGFGLAYLEAAAAGLPSIAGRIGGVPEAVLDGETGILVDPGDEDGLAKSLALLIENDEIRKQMGEKGRLRARELSWGKCALLTYGGVDR